MKLFLVSPRKDFVEKIEEKIKENFGENYIELPDRLSPTWIVAAEDEKYLTSVELADLLGMYEEDAPTMGAVFELIGTYHGHDRGALWEKLDVWAD